MGVGPDEEVAARGPRGDLTEIHHNDPTARVSRDPEAASADVARFRPGHREREANRDGGVGGIAPLLQDLDPDSRSRRFGRRDRPSPPGLDLALRGRRVPREEKQGSEPREDPSHWTNSMFRQREQLASSFAEASEDRSLGMTGLARGLE